MKIEVYFSDFIEYVFQAGLFPNWTTNNVDSMELILAVFSGIWGFIYFLLNVQHCASASLFLSAHCLCCLSCSVQLCRSRYPIKTLPLSAWGHWRIGPGRLREAGRRGGGPKSLLCPRVWRVLHVGPQSQRSTQIFFLASRRKGQNQVLLQQLTSGSAGSFTH